MHAMTSHEAARSLGTQLRSHPWFVTVGVADQPGRTPPSSTLIVYVSSKHPDQRNIVSDWMGYHVRVEVSGRPRPA